MTFCNNDDVSQFLAGVNLLLVMFSGVLEASPLRADLPLRDILNARDGIRIPCVSARYSSRHPDVLVLAQCEYGAQVDAFLDNPISGDSEQSVVGRDATWVYLIRQLVPAVRIQLNTHDASSMKFLRPDISVSCFSAVGLRGELKSSRAMMGEAESELTTKLKPGAFQCFPSGRNSIFGITSFPDLIIVHEIWCDRGTFGSTVLKVYEIGMEIARVEFIRDLVNIVRWLRSIDGPRKVSHLVLDQHVNTPNGHIILWNGESIQKTFKTGTTKEVVKRIKAVYKAQLDHVEWGTVPSGSARKIEITRVGIPLVVAIRSGKISVDDAAEHIRLAINELHDKIGFAHCDVRVDNCFYDDQMRVAFLDDLEYLTPLESRPPQNIWGPLPLPSTARALDFSQYAAFVRNLRAM